MDVACGGAIDDEGVHDFIWEVVDADCPWGAVDVGGPGVEGIIGGSPIEDAREVSRNLFRGMGETLFATLVF